MQNMQQEREVHMLPRVAGALVVALSRGRGRLLLCTIVALVYGKAWMHQTLEDDFDSNIFLFSVSLSEIQLIEWRFV